MIVRHLSKVNGENVNIEMEIFAGGTTRSRATKTTREKIEKKSKCDYPTRNHPSSLPEVALARRQSVWILE